METIKSLNMKIFSEEQTDIQDFFHLFEEDGPFSDYTKNIIGARTLNRKTQLYLVTFKAQALNSEHNHRDLHNLTKEGLHVTTKTGKKFKISSRIYHHKGQPKSPSIPPHFTSWKTI